MSYTDFRLPAEWERQSATLLAWPSPRTDWATRLPGIQHEYTLFIRAVAQRQPLILLIPPGSTEAQDRLGDLPGLKLIELPYDDTWCRDYGPITLVGGQGGKRLALDFFFGGWGGKYAAGRDNRVNTLLARHPDFKHLQFRQHLFELEGGAIESDGHGSLLINWHCLHTRHPHLQRGEIEFELKTLLNLERIIGIDIEPLVGDDTDGHIDTIARFARRDCIAYQAQADAQRHSRLLGQLKALEQSNGQPYELIELPVPEGFDPSLPANYVNFLFVNGACLVPAYGVPADTLARERLTPALPEHAIESVAAAVMIEQYGGPHCASMQIPASFP